jgi:hypothetical protein
VIVRPSRFCSTRKPSLTSDIDDLDLLLAERDVKAEAI